VAAQAVKLGVFGKINKYICHRISNSNIKKPVG